MGQATEPLTETPITFRKRLQMMVTSRGGMFLLGWTGGALLIMVIYSALHTSQAQFSFPPRILVKGNSLYERLLAAGKKSPISMAGVSDGVPVVAGVESRAGAARSAIVARSATIDLTAGQLPSIDADKMAVTSGQVSVQGVELHYAQSLPTAPSSGGLTFLLLHGARFSSATWRGIKTLRTLAALGYRAVAIDLPGGFSNSKSRGRLSAGVSKADFLSVVVRKLSLSNRVVLVSPSASGEFSVPLLIQQPDWLVGYVPVAPVGTHRLTAELARDIQVPTAIVYGSNDHGLGASSLPALLALPRSMVAVIPDGNHPAYLDDPALWHLILYNFAGSLDQPGHV